MGHILERRKGNEKSRKRTYVRQNGRKEDQIIGETQGLAGKKFEH